MKTTLLTLAAGMLVFTLTAFGQNAQPQTNARPNAPHAWGDKNKDGICDVTGKPVGQGRAQAGAGRMGRMGRRGRGQMRGGMCNCCMQSQAAAPAPAPAPPAAKK
ncbi:MAG: hypothetical protein ACE15B_00280 [Bryobacteraceae bacterium]